MRFSEASWQPWGELVQGGLPDRRLLRRRELEERDPTMCAGSPRSAGHERGQLDGTAETLAHREVGNPWAAHQLHHRGPEEKLDPAPWRDRQTQTTRSSRSPQVGAGIVVAVGVSTTEYIVHSAENGIDWYVIFLLLDMMIIVGIPRRTGIFEFVAIWAAVRAEGSPLRVMILLVLILSGLSSTSGVGADVVIVLCGATYHSLD